MKLENAKVGTRVQVKQVGILGTIVAVAPVGSPYDVDVRLDKHKTVLGFMAHELRRVSA